MTKIAIVDKYDRNTDYSDYFDVEFDLFHLSTQNKKRLLKADITLEIDPEEYDFIITVGADPTKHLSKKTVLAYQGTLIDEKYLPIVDPNMLAYKPEMKSAFDRAVQLINEYVHGVRSIPKAREALGIQTELEAEEILLDILNLDRTAVALDTETVNLFPRDGHLLGLSISADIRRGYYIDSDCLSEKAVDLLQKIINKHTIVFQNAKFDIAMLAYHLWLDFNLSDIKNYSSFEDTLLLHYVLNETTGSHGLKDLCIKYTDLGDYDKELDTFKRDYCRRHKMKLNEFTYDLIPFEIMYPYAAIDAMGTLELYLKFSKLVVGTPLELVYNFLRRGIKFLIHVQDYGVPFSRDRLLKAQSKLTNEIFDLQQNIYQFPEIGQLEKDLNKEFTPNSPQQLVYLFYTLLRLEPIEKRTDTGNYSMDAEVMELLENKHPIVKYIAKIKKLKKIKSTYIDKILLNLDSDDRLRTNYNLTTTTSGRLSSSGKLNMQQLPRDNKIVKACIYAPPGYKIVSQDLATAEMYVAAVLSDDKNLQQIFINSMSGGADFHSTIAHMVFRLDCEPTEVKKLYPLLRQAAKAISFGILYGSGPDKVAETVNADGDGSYTVNDALNDINTYFNTFPALKTWLDNNKDYIKENGYIYSIFNRKRRLGNVFSSNRSVQGHEVRSGINFLIQSVASDINLFAAIELQQYILDNKLDVEIFGLVHDSILAIVKDEDLPEYLDVAKDITQKDFGCMIPGCPIGIDQEIGKDYSFVENYEI